MSTSCNSLCSTPLFPYQKFHRVLSDKCEMCMWWKDVNDWPDAAVVSEETKQSNKITKQKSIIKREKSKQ